MAEDLDGRNPLRPLQGGKDSAEMGDHHDISLRLGADQPVDAAPHPRRKLVPAFAAGWTDVSRPFPESPGEGLVLGGDFGMATQFPVAEMDFAQIGIMGQAGWAALDRIGRMKW